MGRLTTSVTHLVPLLLPSSRENQSEHQTEPATFSGLQAARPCAGGGGGGLVLLVEVRREGYGCVPERRQARSSEEKLFLPQPTQHGSLR